MISLPTQAEPPSAAERYRLVAWSHFTDFTSASGAQGVVLTSPPVMTGAGCDQVIASWNVDAPPQAAATIQVRALSDSHTTGWYTMGEWSPSGHEPPRTSVKGQKDADGEVDTDTLKLTRPAPRVQVRVVLAGGAALRFLSLSLTNTEVAARERPADRAVWGRELKVPALSQLSYTGGQGWCSPTSVSMVLDYWAQKKGRPEWAADVPECAAGIQDQAWDGTGNWPFNTAYAGSKPGLRAYVTRLDSAADLEGWIAQGVPVVLSVSIGLDARSEPGASGHLVVCTGFTPTGDLVVNDPWTHLDRGEAVRHTFKRADLDALWRKSDHAAYIIHPTDLQPPQENSFQ